MKFKSAKIKTQETTYERPPNPRQYRPKNLSDRKRIKIIKPIEQPSCSAVHGSGIRLSEPSCISAAAPREEIIAQIKVESEYRWGLEADDAEDFNPYKIDNTSQDAAHDDLAKRRIAPSFEWVTVKQEIEGEPSELLFQIKQEELDLDYTGPVSSTALLGLPSSIALSQDEIKVEPPEEVPEIKQEIDNDSIPASEIAKEALETISLEDDDSSKPSEQIIESEEGIFTICIDDSADESPSVGPLQKPTPVHNYEHTCVPRRLYPYYFVKRFVKRSTYRGYSIRTAKLLNGARNLEPGHNKFTHIYVCDVCDKLCASFPLIRQHLSTHDLEACAKRPMFLTTECQMCFQKQLGDAGQIWEHFEQKHSEELYKAAQGQKFAVRLECRICRRWFPQIECLECGESYDRTYGIMYHHRIHRSAESWDQTCYKLKPQEPQVEPSC